MTWQHRKSFLFNGALFVFVLLIVEGFGWLVLNSYSGMKDTRDILVGDLSYQAALNTIGQPYLLYTSAPGFSSDQYRQHNEDGYRGDRVPLQKREGAYRILFMGGSTTYSEGVENPSDSYPSKVGQLLKGPLKEKFSSVEVINAGLRFGTSAEILTHYLMKYRYYKPDLLVINTGGNDPIAYTTSNYHPDYSNWRKTINQVEPLRNYSRWLMKSRFISVISILLFYPDVPQGNTFVHSGESAPIDWFLFENHGQIKQPADIVENALLSEVAFYRNLMTVVREAKLDETDVLLLSYQGNPQDRKDQKEWRKFYNWHEYILRTISEEQEVMFLEFPLHLVKREHWVDASHLNIEGAEIKARYVASEIERMVKGIN